MALLFFQIFWDFWKFYSIGQTKAIRYFSRPYRTHWRLPNWPCSDRTWPFRQAKAKWYLVWPHTTRLMLPDWPYNDQIWHAKQLQTIQSELPHPVCASWPISERVTCDVDTRPRPHTSIIVFTRKKVIMSEWRITFSANKSAVSVAPNVFARSGCQSIQITM